MCAAIQKHVVIQKNMWLFNYYSMIRYQCYSNICGIEKFKACLCVPLFKKHVVIQKSVLFKNFEKNENSDILKLNYAKTIYGFATGFLRYLVIFTVIPPANPLNYSEAALGQPYLESSFDFSGLSQSGREFSGGLTNMFENTYSSFQTLLGIQPHPENDEELMTSSLNSTILGELFFFLNVSRNSHGVYSFF